MRKTTLTQKETNELIKRALACEVSEKELASLKNLHNCKREGAYSIDRIRACFDGYFKGERSRTYLNDWCDFYGKVLNCTYEVKTRRDIAYEHIKRALWQVEEHVASPLRMLAEIEVHNDVLEGRRQADYWLAEDSDFFYVMLDAVHPVTGGSLVDEIEVNHLTKTYFVRYGVEETDGWDSLDEETYSTCVHRDVFMALLQGLPLQGYRELKEW